MPQADKPALVATPTQNRTDGGPASKQATRYISGMPSYGDAQQLMDMQASAPMSQAQNIPTATPAQVSSAQNQAQGNQPQQPVVPLSAPTQYPNEPVTSGAPSGAGPGPAVLGNLNAATAGGTSAKQVIDSLASHPDASPELRNLASALGQ